LLATCSALEADSGTTAATIAATHTPDPHRVKVFCERLRGSHLRATLVGDLVQLAHVDGSYSTAEMESIENVSRFLGLSFVQLDQLTSYAQRVASTRAEAIHLDQRTVEEASEVQANLAASMAAFFLPLVTLTIVGQGVTSAAFIDGLRTLSMGMGVLGGFLVLALVGMGTFVMVRSMFPQGRSAARS
jgi:hypothetical protein